MAKNKHSDRFEEIKDFINNDYRLPEHIAMIMDGNGRWAKKRKLPRVAGHRKGIKSVRAIVEAAGELGIKAITLYTFSTENWNRPASEVSALMKLLVSTLKKELKDLQKKNVKLIAIGNLNDLPAKVKEELLDGVEKTSTNTGLIVNLALSYSSRLEIINAVKNITIKVKNNEISPDEINEETISSHLYTSSLPDPDLLIRTSGEMRISNFLLWQLAYTEIYITDTLWPDFREDEFYKAIIDYFKRERRFGKISEQIS